MAGVDARRATPPDPRPPRWGLAGCCQLDPSHPTIVTCEVGREGRHAPRPNDVGGQPRFPGARTWVILPLLVISGWATPRWATGFDSSPRADNTLVRAGGVLSVGTPRRSDLSSLGNLLCTCSDDGNASQGADNTSVRAGGVLSVEIPGGDPESLNGQRNLKRFSEFGQTGLNGLSHCLESTYGLRSIIPGHHQIPRFSTNLNILRSICSGHGDPASRGSDGGPRRFTAVVPTPHASSGQWPVKTKRARARSCASVVTRKRPSLNRASAGMDWERGEKSVRWPVNLKRGSRQ